MRWPSSTRLSFCSASLRKTSPRCGLSTPYRVFLRHLGMNTTRYLHSHLLWLRLSYSSIVKLPFVRLVAHDRKLHRWTTAVNVKRLLPPRQSRGTSLGG